jgi:hypothetical protein
MIEYLDIQNILKAYCDPDANIQSQEHIKPFHYYSAIRLVLEGGFEPESILPHPPFASDKQTLEKYFLRHSPEKASKSEATVLGGLRTKQIDLTVRNAEAGPTLGISFKTTNNAFRNIPNRVEELLGDVTNIHLRYPAFTYGFCHIIKMMRETEAPQKNDASFTNAGEPVTSIRQFHDLLTQLVGRTRITDRPEQYESVALLIIECGKKGAKIYDGYPPKDSPVHFSRFFERLYRVYDERYCYVGADKAFCRKFWTLSSDAPTKALNLTKTHGSLAYTVRLSG